MARFHHYGRLAAAHLTMIARTAFTLHLCLITAFAGTALASPVAAAPTPSPAESAKSFSDTLCPAATAPVRKFYALSADASTPVDAYLTQIIAVIASYDRCHSDNFSAGMARVAEYAETRAAQFHFEAGHVQRLAGKAGDARKSLDAALVLAGDITGTLTRSVYYEAAIALRDSVKKELTLLDVTPLQSPSESSPSESPEPVPTAK